MEKIVEEIYQIRLPIGFGIVCICANLTAIVFALNNIAKAIRERK